MPRAYWVVCYRSISNPTALADYAILASQAIQGAGGIFLARGSASKVYECGLMQRTVIVEFPSLERAISAYESSAYKNALAVINGAVERDMRIVEALG